MAQTTYNVTLPHTSLEIKYRDDWYADCPVNDGKMVCGDANGNVIGSHTTNVTSAKFNFKFYGTALDIFGQADSGMTIKLTINYGNAITLTPSNGLWTSIPDFTADCTSYSCRDQSLPSSSSAYNYNTANIEIAQYTVGAKASFIKAVYAYPTRRTGATASITTYNNRDSRIRYTTGWTSNSTTFPFTYVQSGQDVARQFDLSFDGPAVWVWGFCGRRNSGFDYSSYGQFTINSNDNSVYGTSGEAYSSPLKPQDLKCLIYFYGNLKDTGNALTFDSQRDQFLVHSIDVLSVSGGTPISLTTTTSRIGSAPSGISTIGSFGTTTNGTSKAGLIAGPVVAIILTLAIGIAAAIFLRKRSKAKKLVEAGAPMGQGGGASNAPSMAVVNTPPISDYKPTDPHTPYTPPTTHGYLTYTPPPPPMHSQPVAQV